MRKIIPLIVLIWFNALFTNAQNALPADVSASMQLLEANKAAIGITTEELGNFMVSSSFEDNVTGIRYVYLVQSYKGLPVFNQMTVLSFRNGKLLTRSGIYDPQMDKIAAGKASTASVTPESAVQSALSDRGFRATQPAIAINRKDEGRLVEFGNMGISRENITAQLMWVPNEESKTYDLAWQVFIIPKTTPDAWLVRVNAVDNSILEMSNLTDYDHWGIPDNSRINYPAFLYNNMPQGEIQKNLEELSHLFDFKNNNIKAENNDDDPSLVPNADYRVIPIPFEAPSFMPGAPATWHALRSNPWVNATVANATTLNWHTGLAATDYNYTRGNNVWAYHDRTNQNAGDPARSATSSTPLPNLTFNFTPDYTLEPIVTSPPNQQFNITNLFYWNNLIHDILYAYGFTEVGGNFQDDNLGRGGLGNDHVNAEAQDGSGSNNANFLTLADGSSGRMQMYLWTAPTPDRDGDVDNGIIIHEYGHGISKRITGGPANVSCLSNQEHGGEGISDYFALMLTQDWSTATLNTGFNSPRGIGTYALNEPPTGLGIRPARYTTDMTVNNHTYASLPSQVAPHGVGFVWCTMLWEMTWEIINQIGTITPNIYNWDGAGGNVRALRLVMEGLRTQPCSPGFVDAREHILDADTTFYGGLYSCAIWRAFAKRGLGYSALQGSVTNKNDGTPAFDLHPNCLIAGPSVTINQAAAQPDPTSSSPINFTVVFSEPVINFVTGDVTLSGTAGATTGTVTGSGTTFNVAVSGMTGSGTVIASIAAGVCTNAALEPNTASTSTDNTVSYNSSTACGNWVASTVYPIPILDQAVASVGANLYSFTGISNGGWTTNSYRFDGTTWTPIAAYPVGMEYPAAAGDGTNVFIVGGAIITTGVPQTTMYRYNVAANTYTLMAPCTIATWNPTAVHLGGKIYKFGGTTATATISSSALEIYDIATNTWSAGANMPAPGSFIGGFTDGTFIYACGGLNATGTVPSLKTYRYNIATNTWDDASIADLPATRWGPAYGFFDGKGLLAGGYVGGAVTANISNTAISWDPTTNTWASLSNLVGERARFNGGVIGGSYYAVGGRSVASSGFIGTNINQVLTCNTPPGNNPTVTINQAAAQADPTSATPINFTAVFSQPVIGFATGDVTLSGTAGATNAAVTGGPSTYNISVSGMTNSGTVIATIAAGVCTNAALDPNLASTSTDNNVTFNLVVGCTSVNPIPNDTVCNNSPAGPYNFTSPTPGTTFTWTNDNPSIGLAANGAGNIPAFIATNVTTAPINATITVTPTVGACTGTPRVFIIRVNPTGQVNPVASQVLCRGASTTAVNFSSTAPGTVFSWVNNNTTIGLAAAGQGNIPSFIAQNPTAIPQVATITVTPSYGSGGIQVTQNFNYTGAVQTWVVPAGVTSINVKSWGAQGNSNALSATGGLGGYAEGTLAVTPGQTLYVNVGGGGTVSGNAGFNGGGVAGTNTGCATARAGGGGGASDVRVGANTLVARAIVAGGGGGAGGNRVAGCGRGSGGGGGGGYFGGGGGAGWPGVPPGGPVPTGGTQSAGGAGGITTWTAGGPTNGFPGVSGIGGAGGNEVFGNQAGSATGSAGGTGGGLIGSNGQYVSGSFTGHSGAGGSSYIGGVGAGITTAGLRTGNGRVEFAYAAGGVACNGTPVTFTITVNPNQDLVIVADPGTTLCEGDPTLLTVRDLTGAPSAPVPEILYYKFDGTGTSVPNLASAPPPGSAVGTIIGNQTQGGIGQCGTALVGIGGPANANHMTTGWNTNFTGPFTISFWLGANQVDNNPSYLFGNSSAASVFRAFYGGAALGNNMLLRGGSGDILITGVNPAATLVTVVYNGTNTAVYKNGVFFQNYAVTFNTTAPAPFLVGGYNSTSLSMTGRLDEFRLYNRALSAAEVGQLTNCSTGASGPISTGTFLWSPAAGLSSTTSNPVAASPMNTTTYTVVRTTSAGCVASAQITITVNQRPTVTTQPVSRTNCAGSAATFTVAGTGTGLTYQWQVSTTGCAGTWANLANGGVYSGVNTPILSISAVTTLMNGYAYRAVLSGVCAPVNNANISSCAVLTVNPLPVVSITPAGPVCGGVAGLFGVMLSTASAAPPVPGSVTVNSGTVSVPIPEGAFPNPPATAGAHTLAVAGIPANATITDISVKSNITHPYVGDVVMVLRAPNGQILNLDALLNKTNNPGANFLNTVISATGTTTLDLGTAPWTGTYRADLVGATFVAFGFTLAGGPVGYTPTTSTWSSLYPNPNGNWTIAMYDAGAPDLGTLTNWEIKIDYTTPGGTGTPLTYTWSPATGLYMNATATIPYVAGTQTPVVYAAPTVQTTYTVTGTDGTTGCINTASVLVNYTPPAPTVTPSSVTMCLGDPAVRLVATSSTTLSVSATTGPISLQIPDNTANGVSSALTISGIPVGATIASMSVTLNMPHTYPHDMVFNLRAPNGQILNLYKHHSNTTVFPPASIPNAGWINAVVNSTSAVPFGAVPNPFRYGETAPAGPYRADALNGVTSTGYTIMDPAGFVSNAANFAALYTIPNGTYTLAMADGGPADFGTLTSWSITVNYVLGVPASPATWSPIGGLFNDANASIAYTGDARDTVWTRPTPSGVYPYTVTVNNIISSGAIIPLPPHVSTFTGNVRGYWFIAPSSFTMSSVEVPTSASTGTQNIAVLRFNGATPPPAFPATTNAFTQLFLTQNNPAAGAIPVNIQINAGDVIGILGYRSNINSYSGLPPNTTVINGTTVNLTRMGMQFPLTTTAPQQIWQEPAGAISRVFFSTAMTGTGTCTSPARTVVVTVHQPTTVATQPVADTVCTDQVATFTVVGAGSGPFTYQWQVSSNGGNTWTIVTNGGVYSGATTATLTITAPPVTMSGNLYRVIITGAAPCAAATSLIAILTVNPLPTIVLTASPHTSLYPGLQTTISSVVTPNPVTTGGYSWIRNGVVLTNPAVGIVSGLGTGSIVVNVDGMGDYQLRVTDVKGCTSISNIITIKDSITGKCFIYPNPTSGIFEVRYYSVPNNVLPRSLTIFDAKGDRVFTQFYSIGAPYDRMPVDMRAYGKGLYWVEIGDRNGNRLSMCRVVIQ